MRLADKLFTTKNQWAHLGSLQRWAANSLPIKHNIRLDV